MNMGKRYQRGGREVRVSQFFSLTGRRDCVFLSLPNARKRNFLPCTGGRAPPSGFRFVSRHNGLDAALDDVFASEASSNCHPVDKIESLPLLLPALCDYFHFESFPEIFRKFSCERNSGIKSTNGIQIMRLHIN